MHEARQKAGLESELWVLPGGEHGFDNYPPEGIFWNRILDFFRPLSRRAASRMGLVVVRFPSWRSKICSRLKVG